LTYSIQSRISATDPLMVLTLSQASAPTVSQSCRNSSVPKPWSSSSKVPKFSLKVVGRCSRGPMPSRQW